jgi:hypothetical protein
MNRVIGFVAANAYFFCGDMGVERAVWHYVHVQYFG